MPGKFSVRIDFNKKMQILQYRDQFPKTTHVRLAEVFSEKFRIKISDRYIKKKHRQ